MINITDMDQHLQRMIQTVINLNKVKYKIRGPRSSWAPGKKLKLLCTGYVGARNTGASHVIWHEEFPRTASLKLKRKLLASQIREKYNRESALEELYL